MFPEARVPSFEPPERGNQRGESMILHQSLTRKTHQSGQALSCHGTTRSRSAAGITGSAVGRPRRGRHQGRLMREVKPPLVVVSVLQLFPHRPAAA